MKYRNKKTGGVVVSATEIKGEDWEEVKEVKEEPKKTTRKKKE